MWIFSRDGFVSVVQMEGDNEKLQARARDSAHLERLFPGEPVIITPDRDYPFRVIVGRDEVAAALTCLTQELDYSNFKGALDGDEPDSWYSRCLHYVWEVVYDAAYRIRPTQ